MKPKDITIKAKNYSEARLLGNLINQPIDEILLKGCTLDYTKYEIFKKQLDLVGNNYPLDYILGRVKFLDREFFINENVLIPRAETEWWVKLLINRISSAPEIYLPKTLVDLGCGCGIIGISLSKYFNKTYLLDISEEALKVARINIETNSYLHESDYTKSENNIFTEKGNGLSAIQKKQEKSLVVPSDLEKNGWMLAANLPYVPIEDLQKAEEMRVNFEPQIAIYSGADGLNLFKQIIMELKANFEGNLPSEAWFELDPRNIKQAESLVKKTFGPKLKSSYILKDENDLDRVLTVEFLPRLS